MPSAHNQQLILCCLQPPNLLIDALIAAGLCEITNWCRHVATTAVWQQLVPVVITSALSPLMRTAPGAVYTPGNRSHRAHARSSTGSTKHHTGTPTAPYSGGHCLINPSPNCQLQQQRQGNELTDFYRPQLSPVINHSTCCFCCLSDVCSCPSSPLLV